MLKIKKALIIGEHTIVLSASYRVQVTMKTRNGTKLKMDRSYADPKMADKAFGSWANLLERSVDK